MPYAATKVAADQLVLSFHKSFSTSVTVLRPFNAYGSPQSARSVIPTITSHIAAGHRQIKLGALTPKRDFTSVRDTAQGFIQAMNCDPALGCVVNIGSGFEIFIAEGMGVEVEVLPDPTRLQPEASEVERLFAGVVRAKSLFNAAPAYGGRDGGLVRRPGQSDNVPDRPFQRLKGAKLGPILRSRDRCKGPPRHRRVSQHDPPACPLVCQARVETGQGLP